MDKFFFKLDLRPTPMARARVTRFGTFDPKEKQKQLWRWEIAQIWPYLPCEGEICLDLTFTLAPAKSYSTRKKKGLLNEPHTKKPDLSNFLKFAEDCMSGIVFRDDAQITSIKCTKKYGAEDGFTCLLSSAQEFQRAEKK